MTKRYFYTDPLAANWMEKHFRMAFEGLNMKGESYTAFSWPNHWNYAHKDKIYIHPDSLGILEPQTGDIISTMHLHYNSIKFHRLEFYSGDPGEPYPQIIEAMKAGGKIIQRNGIAFMWPESEDV